MFDKRSHEPERIDTGDYTPQEYKTFLREIAFINRYLGDGRALKKALLEKIEANDLRNFSVLDVGCGSGELLRMIAEFAEVSGRKVRLTGLDLHPISSAATHEWSKEFTEIVSVQGDAFALPFDDGSFDYTISSLFFHHLTDDQIVDVLGEMSRVSRREVIVIDLNRDPIAYVAYRLFCFAFRISPLVRHDGSLSIKKAFLPREMRKLAVDAGFENCDVDLVSPGRVVLRAFVDGTNYERQETRSGHEATILSRAEASHPSCDGSS